MMSARLADAYNAQISLELASSHAYLQLAAYFADTSLTGFESWMRAQADEERMHALKFFDFVLDRGNQADLGAIDGPGEPPTSALEAFEIALAAERSVTESIRNLHAMAREENDAASYPLLEWFLTEQVEEEASVGEIVDQLRFADGNPAAVLMLDREHAGRAHVTPAE
ncbi:MAG: ferritin [Acidimicrobiia bacterium]|nr:MAG: ferritin [Acidimicrobiia bacterium]